MPENRQQLTRDLVLIFAIGLLFRIALLFLFPVPYGNDAAGRLYFRDSILAWHWLPVTQALVYLSYAASHSVAIVRSVFAVASSLSAVAFTFYLQALAHRRAALIGGMMFATNSLFIYLSLMPYQEIIFLGLLFGGLAFFNKAVANPQPRSGLIIGYTLYGLACLTRYEAWFILPALFLARIWRELGTRNMRAIVQRSAMNLIGLCWAPAFWMVINWQTWGSPTAFLFHRADHAFYAWDPHAEIARIAGYIGQLFYWLGRFGSPLVLLALPGIGVMWKNRKTLLPFLWPLLLLLFLALLFLVFIAAREFATANRFAIIPLSVTLVFATLGAGALLERARQSKQLWLQMFNRPAPKALATSLALLFLLIYGAVPVAQANRLADFREPYEIAEFLETRMSSGECAVIVAEHRRELAEAAPMPYQRIFGQLNLDRDHLLCASFIDSPGIENVEAFVRARNVRYLIVFGGNWPRHGSDAVFLELVKNPNGKARMIFANRAAAVYEIIPAIP